MQGAVNFFNKQIYFREIRGKIKQIKKSGNGDSSTIMDSLDRQLLDLQKNAHEIVSNLCYSSADNHLNSSSLPQNSGSITEDILALSQMNNQINGHSKEYEDEDTDINNLMRIKKQEVVDCLPFWKSDDDVSKTK